MKKTIKTTPNTVAQALALLNGNTNRYLVWHTPKSRFFASTTNVGAEIVSTVRNLSPKNINDLNFKDRFGNDVVFEV